MLQLAYKVHTSLHLAHIGAMKNIMKHNNAYEYFADKQLIWKNLRALWLLCILRKQITKKEVNTRVYAHLNYVRVYVKCMYKILMEICEKYQSVFPVFLLCIESVQFHTTYKPSAYQVHVYVCMMPSIRNFHTLLAEGAYKKQ